MAEQRPTDHRIVTTERIVNLVRSGNAHVEGEASNLKKMLEHDPDAVITTLNGMYTVDEVLSKKK